MAGTKDPSKTVGIAVFAIAVGAGAYYLYTTLSGDEATDSETGVVEEVVGAGSQPPEQVEISIPAPADVAAMPDDAVMTAEGVGIRTLVPGDGLNFPSLDDDVVVYYTGWTTDGQMFDSSHTRGEADTFPLGKLIAGWQSAVPHMSKGEKALVWIPGDLAYDLRPDRPNAPKGMLVFEIELLDFMPAQDAIEE
ncbi:MAG TPA: FKBP-type peptidyl-prolyl cis-trans isomerase [Sphingomonadales bacterium]|nr:FKBP-type peptidyl-prolyl cis-trans isomerase [Sphingomonadales bacterium]